MIKVQEINNYKANQFIALGSLKSLVEYRDSLLPVFRKGS